MRWVWQGVGRRAGERGIALVAVLWIGLLVAAIAGAFVADTRTSARLARNFVDNAKARALADGGVHIALFHLLDPSDATRWRRDGRIYRLSVPGGSLAIAISDEAGKIDMNWGSLVLFEQLFTNGGMKPEAARELTREIDARRAASTGDRGPFGAVDLLNLLPGMTPPVYHRIRDALTVYSYYETLDIPTAPPIALLAIPGMTKDAVASYVADRQKDDGEAALDAFLEVGQAADFLRKEESAFVTIRVSARAENGARFGRVAVAEFLNRGDSPYTFHEWREDNDPAWPPPPTDKDGPGRIAGLL